MPLKEEVKFIWPIALFIGGLVAWFIRLESKVIFGKKDTDKDVEAIKGHAQKVESDIREISSLLQQQQITLAKIEVKLCNIKELKKISNRREYEKIDF